MTNPPSVKGPHYFDIFRFERKSVAALCIQLGCNLINQFYILALEIRQHFYVRERYLE